MVLGPEVSRALAATVTGEAAEDFPALGELRDVGDLPAALAEVGWSQERIRAHRARCLAEAKAWPHPQNSPPIGPAQWVGLVNEVRALWAPRAVQRPGPPTAADARLLADRPPHWG